MIMSGGVGARFGADCPKQYTSYDNRMVIDYVFDECRKTKGVDAIVVVAAADYVEFISKRYSVDTVVGGGTRPESVANGLKFINEKFACEKLIITNAVCPLATSEQYDKYFNLLDTNDYILTTWKLASALHRFDGVRVDRDDFFNVMEPDAYRFRMLYDNYDFTNVNKYIFHNMPSNSKGYYCFDYPYTMKLTYAHDLQLLKVLYDEIILKPSKETTLQIVNNYLSASGSQDINNWIRQVQFIMKEVAPKYSVTTYNMNSQTEANIVYEAESSSYGSIVLKFTPTEFHFHKEFTYYKHIAKGIMAEIIDTDKELNLLVIKTIKPGIQVKFDETNVELRKFFDCVDNNMIHESELNGDQAVPDVMSEFQEYVNSAEQMTYEYEFRKKMEGLAFEVWNAYFSDQPKYYLHRDLHRRNLLTTKEGIKAIDPRGTIGPKAFEYVIQFIIELRESPEELNKEKYNSMMNYFTKYVEREDLLAAMFIFWIYKMNDYCFQKNDDYKLASWCKKCILAIYFNDDETSWKTEKPNGLKKI